MIGKLGGFMNENMYKVLHAIGASSIAIGIIVVVVGLVTGTLSIIAGAKLLKEKKNIIF